MFQKFKNLELNRFVRICWSITAIVMVIFFICAASSWTKYKKGQDLAITSMMTFTDEYADYEGSRKELINKMYKDCNPSTNMSVVGKMYGIDTSDYYESAEKLDKALGKLLSEAGYKCYNGSMYLEHTNFIDYVSSNYLASSIIVLTLITITVAVNVVYKINKKEE